MFGVRGSAFSYDQRSIPVAHARSAWQQRILVRDVGIGVNRYGRYVEFLTHTPFVKCLDIFESLIKRIPVQINLILGDPIKHERVVRIRRMAERKTSWFWRHCAR